MPGGVPALVHPEPFAWKGEARERGGLPAVAQVSEVHLPKRRGGGVLVFRADVLNLLPPQTGKLRINVHM